MFNIDLDRSAIVQVTGHEKSAPIEKLISRLLVTQVRISIQWTHSHIWADCTRFHKMGISFMSLWPLYPVLHRLWFFGCCLSLLLPHSPASKILLVTPLHAGRQCWGKTILPRAGYGLGTYRTVDIFNFSLISWAILEKLRFLYFYIIKSMARKGYFGPKFP